MCAHHALTHKQRTRETKRSCDVCPRRRTRRTRLRRETAGVAREEGGTEGDWGRDADENVVVFQIVPLVCFFGMGIDQGLVQA